MGQRQIHMAVAKGNLHLYLFLYLTTGLKKSSRVTAKLYKAWLKNKTPDNERSYKNYIKTFKRLAHECEAAYYREMFDKKTNTIKQIWKNLNTVCSFTRKLS